MCDNGPTQPVYQIEMDRDETEDSSSTWAKLLPIGTAFSPVDLIKETTVFGRRADCDVLILKDSIVCNATAYSNVHFKIKKEFNVRTGNHALLEDCSTNGTFINGEKLGKGRVQALKNNSEIALSKKENKAYVFIELGNKEEKTYPVQLRNKYTITKTLGVGAYGEVKLAFEKHTCEKYAIKIISKKKFTVHGRNQLNLNPSIQSEVNILKQLEHPCIIKIKEVIDAPDAVYIVLELLEGGELFDKVVSIGKYPEPTAKLIFYQMAHAVKYLHDQGISHRDLKPENILLSSNDNIETLIKVTDFGLSKFIDATTLMKTFCGTPNYLAPEVLITRGAGTYTNKIDNWSLGVILYICLVGYPPFSDETSQANLEKQIINGIYDFPDQYWSEISSDAIDVVKRLLCTDPEKRASLDEILEHPWIKNDPDAVRKATDLMYPDKDKLKRSNSHLSDGSNGSQGENLNKGKKLKENSLDSTK